MNVTIITGQSGAGKSTALQVLEDMQLFTADGVPPLLLPEVAQLMLNSPEQPKGLAFGVDQRRPGFADELSSSMSKLKALGLDTALLFLSCDTAELIRRYATTRRPHPRERTGVGLEQAISEEREALIPIRRLADMVIDTTSFSLHDLRRELQHRWTSASIAHPMKINLVSFGFKYGVPHEADLMFDVRFLPNPYFNHELRAFSGCDQAVVDYIFSTPDALTFKERFMKFMLFLLPQYEKEGRYRLTIAIGCTGGRHRSVALTEALAAVLHHEHFTVSVEHRHMDFG